MVNKPQHGWQSFRAAHKPPHHMAYSTDTTGSTDGLRPEPLQPPIYALLMSNRAVCRAYIVSVKTEPNLTVYSLHILLGMESGEEKTDLVPFRASHLLVTVIVYSHCSSTLCRRQNVKNSCNDLILLVGRHCCHCVFGWNSS